MTRVKICGLTSLDDARCAAEAGADFLGFIFYPGSPRYVAPRAAGAIIAAIREQAGSRAPRMVGVFVDASLEAVRATAEEIGLDLVQLHGDESPDVVRRLQPLAFKALRPQALPQAQEAYYRYRYTHPSADPATPELLADAYHPLAKGGTGELTNTTVARWLAQRCRLMLAGGLTPENVGQIIATVHPWGVDVSSGVEAGKGIKDHSRVRAFVDAVRAADDASAR